jgi:Protein of unknown function DUF262/Protein of unknown function (DUF1524)
MAQTLVAHEQPIQKIFSDDYVFSIPDYQRPYAWTTEEARELIEDLLGFIEATPGQVSEMPSYFLGSIVLIKGDSPKADVVDGQQRLTTLTLLLAAIRANIDIKLRSNITKRLYEEGDPLTGTDDRFRLTLRERDAEFFKQYVQKENGFENLLKLESALTDSRKNLRDNARLYQSRLQTLSEKQRVELASFVLQRCYIVVVASSDETSAFRIFAVLNSRGLDLTAPDILKAKLIGGVPEQLRDSYTVKWEEAEEELGRDGFNSLFGYIRTVYSKTKAKEILLKEFEQYVTDAKSPTKFIDSVLLPMTRAYFELTHASYAATSHAESANEHLKWLNRLEFTDWLPPALAFVVRHRENPEAMHTFLRDLERLAYWMLVIRSGVNDRIERFAKVTQDIEAGINLSSENSALQLTPYEQDRFYSELDGPIYQSLSAKARTPILLRLDSLLSDGGAEYSYPVISVEHVLPQNPPEGSEWLKWFPSPELRFQWVNRLGNLALLTRKKNSSASNLSFAVKKDTYFKRDGVCAFPLTTQVINERVWDVNVVAKRQAALLARLEAHWRLQNRRSILDELTTNVS